MNDRDRKLAMDACRPGSDDLQLDELRFLAEAMQDDVDLQREFELTRRSDSEIASRMADVEIPDNLRQRILNRLQLNQELTRPIPRLRSVSRRWVGVAMGLTAAASVIGIVYSLSRPAEQDDVTVDQLAQWAQQEWKLSDDWTPLRPEDNDSLHPPSRLLRQPPTRWQRLRTKLDENSVVYDFEKMPVPARLHVLHVGRRLSQLPVRPVKRDRSRGWITGVWQEGDYVYILTVIGNDRDYHDLILPHEPQVVNATFDNQARG